MSDPVFSLIDVEKRYNHDIALSLERLDFHAGQLYALIGANGSGKSTLLQIMALLLAPEKGRLVYRGQTIGSASGQRRRVRQEVTLVHQEPYLFHASVLTNIAYGLKLRGIGGRERQHRIEEALERVGLKGFADRQARELSGGEKQRVALARALVLKPRVLLLDEPTASINPGDIPPIEEVVRTLAQSATVVMATHDPEQPRRLDAVRIHFEHGRPRPA